MLKFYSSCKYLFANHAFRSTLAKKILPCHETLDSLPHFSLQALFWFFALHLVISSFYVCLVPFSPLTSHWSWLVYGMNKMHLRRFGSLGFSFFWMDEAWCKKFLLAFTLLVTLVIHLLFSLSQRKFVKTDIFLYISLSQLRYPDGLKVTFKFVLAAVMIVNVGIVLFIRICSEIAWLSLRPWQSIEIHSTRWITKKHFNMFPPQYTHKLSVRVFLFFHKIICAELHTFHSVANSFMYMFSVCAHTSTHTFMYIFCIYLLTFFWERCKGIFLP